MLPHLDDHEVITFIDKSDTLGVVAAFPKQCRDAVALAEAADLKDMGLPNAAAGIAAIVTLGMGGSGIGGDVVKALVEREAAVPFVVNKGYELPAFVGPSTLVIAVSYSGDTEETLTTFEKALSAGARIVVITSGGQVGERALELNLPVVTVPVGLQPRAAMGYLVLPILVVLRRSGLVPDNQDDIIETIALMDRLSQAYGLDAVTSANQAKQIAENMNQRIPIIYGSEGITAVAALRWKCQINENAKTPAFWNAFPELNHNELVGWQEMAEVTKKFSLIVLRDEGENLRVAKRIGITLPLISGNLGAVTEVWSSGDSPLARLLSLIYLGDFASAYLAILHGVDPTPVDRIRLLKDKLKEID